MKFSMNYFMEYWDHALGQHPHLILEIGYNRVTDYMVHIYNGAGVGIADAKELVIEHDITIEKAGLKALIALNKVLDVNFELDPFIDDEEQPLIPSFVLVDILGLVGINVSIEFADCLTDDEKKQAQEWASAIHLNASDNHDVVVPEKPSFIPFTS